MFFFCIICNEIIIESQLSFAALLFEKRKRESEKERKEKKWEKKRKKRVRREKKGKHGKKRKGKERERDRKRERKKERYRENERARERCLKVRGRCRYIKKNVKVGSRIRLAGNLCTGSKFGRGTTVRGVHGSITLEPLRSALSRGLLTHKQILIYQVKKLTLLY